MAERMHAEGMPGAKPAEWFGPESKTETEEESPCRSCLHRMHEGVTCGWRSVAPDDATLVCTCTGE